MKKFTVYKSSAGSGKTYTLVREYIVLALHSPDYFRHILAITFTNKAANEMKSRILTSLLHLSDPQKYGSKPAVMYMLGELVTRTGKSRDEVTHMAGEVLRAIMHGYDDFSVRTIDSFVTRIIRTFAHDLHLPLDFEIELDKEVLLEEAIDQLLEKVGEDDENTRILIDFTLAKTEDEKSWNLDGDLQDAGSFLFSEEGFLHASGLKMITPANVIEISGKIRKFRNTFRKSLMELGSEAISLISDHSIALDSFFHGRSGIGAFFLKLSKGDVRPPNAWVVKTLEENNWVAGKADPSQRTAIEAIKPDLERIYQKIDQIITGGISRFELYGLIRRHIYHIGVMSALEKELETVRHERKVMHISEFNKRITDIILKEPVPFIYERSGEKYHHYLVDEFQDTSELQWRNLLPLITNSLANNAFNLVVGDGKQAIYRFRNGNVEQFVRLPELPDNFGKEVFGDAAAALKSNFNQELLTVNYRSLPGIIDFNNDLYSFLSGYLHDSLKAIFESHEQQPAPGKTGGRVKIDFIASDNKADFVAKNLDLIYQSILELKSRNYEYRDIVVLVRENVQGSRVARYLIDKGIDVVSSDALLLTSYDKVNFLMSVLRFLNDPGDRIAGASMLFLLQKWNMIRLQKDAIGEVVKMNRVAGVLQESGFTFIPNRLRSLTLYDMCEELIRCFKLNSGNYDPYLQFFLEFIANNTLARSNQLSDLLERWEEKKKNLSVIVPEGINAVRIMTIHKAKGLEFPVVIWPFADESLRTTQKNLWVGEETVDLAGLPVAVLPVSSALEDVGLKHLYDTERNRSLLDMINLIYVTTTRPVEQLIILTNEPGSSRSATFRISGVLMDYLNQSPLKWQHVENAYIYGDLEAVHVPDENLVKEDKTKQPSMLQDFISQPWQTKVLISRRAPDTWTARDVISHQKWGSVVHEALSLIRVADDIDKAVTQITETTPMDTESREKLKLALVSVVNHVKFRHCFDVSGINKSESGLLLPDGNLIRPDKVVIHGDQVTILEFKTGEPSMKHVDQVMKYAAALMAMGHKNIIKYLVYINEELIVEEVI